MASSNPRAVAVDDADSAIRYNGPWSQADGKDFDGLGSNGPAFFDTLHAVSTNASLEFTFNGVGGEILGTNLLTMTGATADPSWDCLIDGVAIPGATPSDLKRNNHQFCSWSNLAPDRSHTVTLNVHSNGHNFFFDRILYTPSTGSSTARNETTVLRFSDSAINYDQSWSIFSGVTMSTDQAGAVASLNFTGSSISWFAMAPHGHTATKGNYQLDNETPVSFDLPQISGDIDYYNQMYFETPTRTYADHKLSVTYIGSGTGDVMPLTLGSLVVRGDNEPVPTSSGSVSSNTSGTTTPSNTGTTSVGSSGSTKVPIGPIIGGVLGGLVLLLICFLTIWYRLRRHRRNQPPVSIDDNHTDVKPFSEPYHDYETTPFTYLSGSVSGATSSTPPPQSSPELTMRNQASTPVPGDVGSMTSLPSTYGVIPPAKNSADQSAWGHIRQQSSLSIPANSSTISPNRPPSIQHEDSGIRNMENELPAIPVVEHPPRYTAV